jgi:hypothetical protein
MDMGHLLWAAVADFGAANATLDQSPRSTRSARWWYKMTAGKSLARELFAPWQLAPDRQEDRE